MAFAFKNTTDNDRVNTTTQNWSSILGRGFLKRYFVELYDMPMVQWYDEDYHITVNLLNELEIQYSIAFYELIYKTIYYANALLLQSVEPYGDKPQPTLIMDEPYEDTYLPTRS